MKWRAELRQRTAAPQLLQLKLANSLSKNILFYHGIPKYIWEITDSFLKSNKLFSFNEKKKLQMKKNSLLLLTYFKNILTQPRVSYFHSALKVQLS